MQEIQKVWRKQMKENKYDDEVFFEKYSQMGRSVNGLKGAGEWSELENLLPNFENKAVLDLGCGYGWHCIYASEHGASKVVGVDISQKMLEVAKQKTTSNNVTYECNAMEDLNYSENSFDVVLSSLAFHYIKDFEAVVKNVNKWLKVGGNFIFSVEHPVFTAEGSQNWVYDENGNISHFPVDNYYYEGKREAVFLDEKVTKYHRTFTTYLNSLLNCGFTITHIVEPKPPESMLDLPYMKDEMRRPMMLLVSAIKAV